MGPIDCSPFSHSPLPPLALSPGRNEMEIDAYLFAQAGHFIA